MGANASSRMRWFRLDIVLVTNGPGEIHSLARPVACRAASAFSAADIWVFMSPSSDASAKEVRVASTYPGVRRAFSPKEFLSYMTIGVRPKGFSRSGRGVVVDLGGTPYYASKLARRLGYPLIAYVTRESTARPRGALCYLAEDERVQASIISRGVEASKVKVVGSLSLDGIKLPGNVDRGRSRYSTDDSTRLISLFPGLGIRQARVMAPFLLRVAELLARVERRVSFVLCLSPFIGTTTLDDILSHPTQASRIDGTCATISRSVGPLEAVTAEGLRVPIETVHRYELMLESDMALVAPGPVCYELSYLGIPHIVAAPLNVPGAVDLPGLSGFMLSLPFVGGALQRRTAEQMRVAGRFLSGPNAKAGRMATPEVVGTIRPEDVVIPSVELLSDPARADRVSRDLREIVGVMGAADAVIHCIASQLR